MIKKNEEIEPTNDELATIFYNNGHYYGYPNCCINEFILKRLVLNDNKDEEDEEEEKDKEEEDESDFVIM